MADYAMVRHSVERSNLPAHEKSAIARYYDKLAGKASSAVAGIGSKIGMARHSVVTGGHAVRKGGEALIIGGALGALDAQLSKSDPSKSGLDVNVAVGNGYNLAIDGAGGLAAMLLSCVPSVAPVAEDLQVAGIVGVASWSQRQIKGWVQGKQAATPAPAGAAPAQTGVHGDPVLDWAASQ